jgi:hypothetical protein
MAGGATEGASVRGFNTIDGGGKLSVKASLENARSSSLTDVPILLELGGKLDEVP